jgi:hypothetical protein
VVAAAAAAYITMNITSLVNIALFAVYLVVGLLLGVLLSSFVLWCSGSDSVIRRCRLDVRFA